MKQTNVQVWNRLWYNPLNSNMNLKMLSVLDRGNNCKLDFNRSHIQRPCKGTTKVHRPCQGSLRQNTHDQAELLISRGSVLRPTAKKKKTWNNNVFASFCKILQCARLRSHLWVSGSAPVIVNVINQIHTISYGMHNPRYIYASTLSPWLIRIHFREFH